MLVDGDESLDFGSLLRRLRLERSLTQETLAERARLSPQSISSLERGTRRAPYRHTVNLLADALELDVAQREALLRAAIRPRSPRMRRPAKVGATHDVRHPRFPAYATRFIGRERELTELAELVDRARLVVVCGFGGVGKTRLAIECAARRAALDRETHFIELTALRDAALVAPRIASAFQLADGAGLDALIEALRERALTLLLDNCESVIDECARIVETLVRGCPNVRVLATSREPFQIDGEAVFRLDALDPGDAAIELFLDRLAASRGTVLETSSVTAARIVRRLDGIPLAIELAAGLARTRDLGDILESLSSVEFLTIAERRSTVGHHRTMHAAIAWSYDALSPDEREDLRQLSYLAAGTTRSGAVALCARDDDRVLRRLVDASLVREDRATGRFTLHEITRQFVAPQSPPEELRHAADRYAAFLGERMRAAFDTGWTGSAAEPLAPFGPLVAELENVRQAFTHALDTGNKRLALALAAGPDYWTIVGRVPEGYDWLCRVRDLCGADCDSPEAAMMHFGLALCAIQSGRPKEAFESADRAAKLAARHDLPIIAGRALITRGHVALARGEARVAADFFARAGTLLTTASSEGGTGRARLFLAFALIELGDADEAERIVRAHDTRKRERHGAVARSERCMIEIALTDVARLRGDLAAAREHGRTALEYFAGGPITSIYARAVHGYVETLLLSDMPDEAQAVALDGLREFHERGFHTEVALLLEIAALLLVRVGRPTHAARCAYFADTQLRRAERTRLRFAADLHRRLHARLDAELSLLERTQLVDAAERERAVDIIASIRGAHEVYD